MAVKELLNRGINIVDFHPVEGEAGGAKQKFRELKRTPLYDGVKGFWKTPEYSLSQAHTELSGILAEGMFDKGKAQKKYEDLKQTSLYTEYWVDRVNDHYLAMSQLLGILAEGMFDKEKARTKYEKLKSTPFYDKEKKAWNARMNKGYMKDTRFSGNQLLGVLVEAMFDRGEAHKKYNNLKDSELYDPKLGEWITSLAFGNYNENHKSSEDQLLGILVEEMFDREEAKRKYEALKQHSINNNGFQLWKKKNYSHNSPSSIDQLLGIIVEAKLEEQDFAEQNMIPVPEVRRF
jgi:hypothetical protein